MVNDVTLGNALKGTLLSLKRTQSTIDVITRRLATGLDVSSALDQPQNFFTARALSNVAQDQSLLLDGIGQSLRSIQEALIGVEAVGELIDQAKAVVQTTKGYLEAGEADPAVYSEEVNISPRILSDQIQSENPDVYYRLNETAGPIVDSGVNGFGPVAATYDGAAANAAALYTNGSAPSVNFDGVNDRIRVADSNIINLNTITARTVELVFNADTITGRQVLYEEGATVNGFTIYIDNGNLRVTAEDDDGAQRFVDLDISTPIVAGQTYHVAFVYTAGVSFEGFLDGVSFGSEALPAGAATFPAHSGNVAIGGVDDGVQFHDGESGAASGFNFDGRISDVAIYNRALSDTVLLNHAESLNSLTTLRYYNENYDTILAQLDRLVLDAQYRGVNLLLNEDLRTDFNAKRTSFLITEGENFSVDGFGFKRFDFNSLEDVDDILEQLREAQERVRSFGSTLTNNLSIIEARRDLALETINTFKSGADDLTVANQNLEGANLLASQTRLALGTTALGLAAISQASILQVLS